MPSDIRSQIEAVNKEFMASFAKRDAAAIAGLYTDRGQLFPAGTDIITGAEGIREFWQGAFGLGLSGATLETLEVDASGDTAVEVGRYRLTAGEAVADQGKYIVVWKSQGGRWKIHKDIWNTNQK
jgi:ketosteroid isomerase-like protein